MKNNGNAISQSLYAGLFYKRRGFDIFVRYERQQLKKQREFAGNILFIDASRHFEKAKNQNYLRPEDIDKIVNTYRERITEDKYSYVATLDEVRENDYNLNIPRYVDTFEEEGPVDLDAISKELKSIDTEMQDTDKIIAGFCNELGIKTPF
jgi:type I restriction enzyme M protein